MATNHPSSLHNNNNADEDDYIDMDLASSCSNYSCSTSSSPKSREFEFQMGSISNDKQTTTSPADELFYRGKLLPLHLPPRLAMVQKLLHTSNLETKNINTPSESCNISPSESCRVSCELNPDEYFFEWSTEFTSFITDHPKKSWSKKLKLVKQSLISQKEKIKASRAYLKSLFSKSTCSDEARTGLETGNKYIKVSKKTPFGQITHPTLASVIKNIEREGVEDNSHRRSFSAAIKRHSPTKCLSSSSSNNSSSATSSSSSSSSFNLNSNGFYELNLLKRSSSATTEIEGSIEAAIAHCKKSQELCFPTRKLNEGGFHSFSISKIAATCESQERPDLCRF